HDLFSCIKRHALYLPSIAFGHATARRCFLLIRSPKAHKVGQIVLTPVPGNKNDGQDFLSVVFVAGYRGQHDLPNLVRFWAPYQQETATGGSVAEGDGREIKSMAFDTGK
ncbi:hypothetical protein, partial [Klebsiella aerogenes]|uniref:hypothetical protein n=1 Tax=Klebsiella aerogenes TaxID=548 RepID=UPI001CE336E2